MTGTLDLATIGLKIERAEKHRADLQATVHEWSDNHGLGIVQHHDRKTGWHIWRAEELPDPPTEWATMLGDFGYNLRAALEYTVELLILNNGGTPNSQNQFPIISKASSIHLLDVQLAGVHPDACDVIEQLQPYQRPNRTEPDLLEVLADLANIDKHHRLHATHILAGPITERTFTWRAIGDGTGTQQGRLLFIGIGIKVGQPITETDLLAMQIEPPEIEVEMHMKEPVLTEIVFSNGGPIPFGKLRPLVTEVGSIVDSLKPWLEPVSPA